MMSTTRRLGTVLSLMASVVGASTAGAQWGASAVGVAEYDTKQTLLLLAGVTASKRGLGLSPMIGIQAFHLGYDVGTARASGFTYRPYVGLSNTFDGGSVNGTVGYSFADVEAASAPPTVATDRGDGVVVTGGWDWWGTGGPLGYQVLGSYNIDTESFWGRGRVSRRISETSSGSMRLGGEVAFLNGTGYRVYQPGAVLEWHLPKGRIVGVGSGAKLFKGGGSAAYFKVEAVLPVTPR